MTRDLFGFDAPDDGLACTRFRGRPVKLQPSASRSPSGWDLPRKTGRVHHRVYATRDQARRKKRLKNHPSASVRSLEYHKPLRACLLRAILVTDIEF